MRERGKKGGGEGRAAEALDNIGNVIHRYAVFFSKQIKLSATRNRRWLSLCTKGKLPSVSFFFSLVHFIIFLLYPARARKR